MKKNNTYYIWLIACTSIFNTIYSSSIAFVRLRKPISYYHDIYNNPAWGLQKMCDLIEKQCNQSTHKVGLAVAKLDIPIGAHYMRRIRASEPHALTRIVDKAMYDLQKTTERFDFLSPKELKDTFKFLGNSYIGCVENKINNYCQPFHQKDKIKSKNFLLVGDFAITNTQELFEQLVRMGLDSTTKSDINIIAHHLAHYLDREYIVSSIGMDTEPDLAGKELIDAIAAEINPIRILQDTTRHWDGGYVFAGLLGNGDMFICRDPAGIRTCYFYIDDEIVAGASTRTALIDVFNAPIGNILTVLPGHVLVIKKNGYIEQQPFIKELPLRQCCLERIYAHNTNDPDIYQYHKSLGRNIAQQVLEALEYNLEHSIFSCIPNDNNEASFIGMLEEIEQIIHGQHAKILWEKIKNNTVLPEDLDQLSECHPKMEQLISYNPYTKNFDVLVDTLSSQNTLVILTNKPMPDYKLLEKLIALNPKHIVIAHTSPLIMYPDYYGIGTHELEKLIAFQALVELLRENSKTSTIKIQALHAQHIKNELEDNYNPVQALYNQITQEQLQKKIAQLIQPINNTWHGSINMVYQTIESLHHAMPDHTGDWAFTGQYPTPGGYKKISTNFLQWFKKNKHMYDV